MLRVFEYWLTTYRQTWRGTIVSSLLTPLLFLAALGVNLGSYVHGGSGRVDGVRYAVYLVPGLLAASCMQVAVGEATYPVLASLKWNPVYLAMTATPLTTTDIFFGHLLFMTARLAFVSVAFIVVASLLGFVPHAGGAALATLAGAMTGVAFAVPIAAFAIRQERDQAFAIIFRLVLIPLFLFSGAFFPVSQLPAAIRPVAYVTPLWHGVSLSRDLALHRGGFAAPLGHAAFLLAVIAASALIGARNYEMRLQR